MSGLLHGPSAEDTENTVDARARYGRALQYARLDSLRTSRAHQDFFAENYTGI
jgi:p-hydroxybenzoate 3-monooxygenase